jgi:uncharacterized OsmC-like protein
MTQETIKAALERNVKAVSLRPSVGQGTARTSVKWREGLTCDIEEGPWKLVAGMTEKYGGSNAGPNPGVYGRAAFGSCLVIGYMMWASRLAIPVRSLEVEVQADYDVRGELGVDDSVRPGYTQVRYIVTIDSDGTEEDVMRLLDTAERHSSWLDDLANPVPMQREVRFVPATAE